MTQKIKKRVSLSDQDKSKNSKKVARKTEALKRRGQIRKRNYAYA